MKYKDYYKTLGVDRAASDEEIKKAYRRLARKYHPDVSKEANATARFQEVSEAYETLGNKEKRAAYDNLGSHAAGQEFRPPPEWSTQYGGGQAFDDVDLADLFANLAGRARGGRRGPSGAHRGQDYELVVPISVEDACSGTEVSLDLTTTEIDPSGALRRVPKLVKARIPKGPTEGQVLRLPGQGGRGAAASKAQPESS